jgi:hypothetical protein
VGTVAAGGSDVRGNGAYGAIYATIDLSDIDADSPSVYPVKSPCLSCRASINAAVSVWFRCDHQFGSAAKG